MGILLLFFFPLLLLVSCDIVNQQSNFSIVKRPTIKTISDNCSYFSNKQVVIRATYLGWDCPRECKAPGLTRSDTCIKDNSGCIYLYGLGGLNPLKDKGSIHTFYGIVKKSPSGVCYIEVNRVK